MQTQFGPPQAEFPVPRKRVSVRTAFLGSPHTVYLRRLALSQNEATFNPGGLGHSTPVRDVPKAVFSKQRPRIREAVRVVQDKPDAHHPGAENWAQAYVASSDLVAKIAKLKAQDGKPMFAYGGAAFARSLVTHGLVDQFDLMIHPLALGQGLPIFTELTHPRRLTLVSSTAFPKGFIARIYRPA